MIRNLIKEPELKRPQKSKSGKEVEEGKEEEQKPRPIVKSASDLQRLKLEKLMKNPAKPVVIPESRKEKDYMQTVPSFVRNVMGSSAGAGSGEFHVYRHLRRKEYARQKTIQAKSTKERLDDDYQTKLEENRRIAEEKTAKKRSKRQKKKERSKRPRQSKDGNNQGTAAEEEPPEGDTSDDAAEEEHADNEDVQIHQMETENTEERISKTTQEEPQKQNTTLPGVESDCRSSSGDEKHGDQTTVVHVPPVENESRSDSEEQRQ